MATRRRVDFEPYWQDEKRALLTPASLARVEPQNASGLARPRSLKVASRLPILVRSPAFVRRPFNAILPTLLLIRRLVNTIAGNDKLRAYRREVENHSETAFKEIASR